MPAEKKPYNKHSIENLLLISGSGRNCGKTTLACKVIKNVSKTTAVYALKISPHFHQMSGRQELLLKQKDFSIFRETDMNSNKDSSRMLQAGAIKSLFLQCDDQTVPEAFKQVMKFLPKDAPVVCESGSLAKSYRPGLHLLIENEKVKSSKKDFLENKQRADKVICFDGLNFNFIIKQILFEKNTWNLKGANQ